MIAVLAIHKKQYMTAGVNLSAVMAAFGQDVTLFTDMPDRVPDALAEVITIKEIRADNPFFTKLCLAEMMEMEGDFTYIDADSIWNLKAGKPRFEYKSFACGLMPRQTLWDDADVRKRFDLSPDAILPFVQSSVMHITEADRPLMELAASVYPEVPENYRGMAPDETALAIACAKMQVQPLKIPLWVSGMAQSERNRHGLWTFPGSRHHRYDLNAYNVAAQAGKAFGGGLPFPGK